MGHTVDTGAMFGLLPNFVPSFFDIVVFWLILSIAVILLVVSVCRTRKRAQEFKRANAKCLARQNLKTDN